ncbi:tail fiber assembly protein [Pandoraea fibrosis]|uniref:Caudovirales tail fiber assembly protein n=1 Tax=Pandoraea fibrosis TaxID=1891094 RepID=A0A5E4XFU3_9BURK|nr:tail fiber assembly protein [Pandoraea fibrosis]VVE35092.1 hypothetical protein PFI31113_03818 [Pandoraea fibrosis]
MLIHHYDHATGAYVSSALAPEDQSEAGIWIVPAFATTDPLPERLPRTWPFYLDGTWQLKPDHRGRVLYRCETGEPAELLSAGVTPEDAGLTPLPRPTEQHEWSGASWRVSAEALARESRNAAMAEFQQRMATARRRNAGRADAFAAGLLNDEETYYFKAWSAYQFDLVRVVERDDFPQHVRWPDEPAPYEPRPENDATAVDQPPTD